MIISIIKGLVRMKSRNSTVLINILSIILVQGLAFFTAPIFSRMLGANNYGIVQIFNTWAAIFEIVFSLSAASTISMTINEYDEKERVAYQSSIMCLVLISYLGWFTLILIFRKPLSEIIGMEVGVLLLCVAYSLGKYIISFSNSKFMLEFKAKNNLLISLSSLILSILLSFIFIFKFDDRYDYYGRVLGLTVSNVLIAIFIAIYVLREGRILYKKEYWRFCLKYSTPIIIHALSNTILNQSDRVMIQSMQGYETVGIYSLAYNFGTILVIIYGALNNSWIPFYFAYLKDSKIEELKKRSNYYAELFVVLAIGFLYLHPEVFRMYASEEYWIGGDIIPVILLGFVMMFLYSFAVNYEFYYKKSKFMAILSMISAIINIILNYFMIGKWGMLGAAIATTITYALQFVLHCTYVKYGIKEQEFPFKIRFFMRYLILFGIFMALFFVFENNFMIRFLISIALGGTMLYKIYIRKTIF